MKLIETITVGSGGVASVTFSAIPATYTDLRLVTSLRGTGTGTDTRIDFNGLTTNQSQIMLRGNGVAASSATETNFYGIQVTSSQTANTFSNGELYIPNYAGANNKSFSQTDVQETNATSAWMYLSALLWSSTAAITSIKFAPVAGNFAQFSSLSLYGIKST